jgi:tRNA(adenine34) deaminase
MVSPQSTPPPCPFDKRFPSQLIRDDAFFMSLAYNQAIDAWRQDEVPIGAVIAFGGEIIASAHNTVESAGDPTAHAEMLAITQAATKLGNWRLEGATLYVTKEPCPMCSGATLMSRLKRVCYAVPDPKMGCLGGATDLNALPRVNHHVELTAGGVLEAECRELIQTFFRLKRTEEGNQDLPSPLS